MKADVVWSGVINLGKMASMGGVEEGLGTGALAAVPSAISWEPHNPVCLGL